MRSKEEFEVPKLLPRAQFEGGARIAVRFVDQPPRMLDEEPHGGNGILQERHVHVVGPEPGAELVDQTQTAVHIARGRRKAHRQVPIAVGSRASSRPAAPEVGESDAEAP